MNKRLKLGVNIDHIATLREARKEGIPDIVKAARAVKRGGAEGITMHLRLDRRHIRDDDVYVIKKENLLPINLEMAPVDEIKEIALEVKPKSVCIVPEKRQELTTEGGLNISTDKKNIRDIIYALKQAGIEISLFIEPSIKFIKEAAEVGADAVELHTGKYANTSGPEKNEELNKIIKFAKQAKKEGLKVNAGHGLNYDNVTAVSKIKELSELNIGYSIVCRSIFTGLKKAVRDMSDLIKNCD